MKHLGQNREEGRKGKEQWSDGRNLVGGKDEGGERREHFFLGGGGGEYMCVHMRLQDAF